MLCDLLAERQMSRLGMSASSAHIVVEFRCDQFPQIAEQGLPQGLVQTCSECLCVSAHVYAHACRAHIFE